MACVLEDAGEALGCGFAPDVDFAVVGGGCENAAVFWVRPGDGPDCSFMAGEWYVSILLSSVERMRGGRSEGERRLTLLESRSDGANRLLLRRS